jgi:hypothetical protein
LNAGGAKVIGSETSCPSVPGLFPNVGAPGIVPAAKNPLPGLKLPCEFKNGILNTYYANLA